MPLLIGKPFPPRHDVKYEIEAATGGKRPDWIGIHNGKELVVFAVSNPGENIVSGEPTNRRWRYYPIPPKAQYVVFEAVWDKHPAIKFKMIGIKEFRDAQGYVVYQERQPKT